MPTERKKKKQYWQLGCTRVTGATGGKGTLKLKNGKIAEVRYLTIR